jgi:hypothetical protein
MRIPLLAHRALLGAAAGAALYAMPLAQADSLHTIGFANGSETFSLTAPSANNVRTGAFSGTWNGTPIVFFCFQLNQYFNFGTTYTDYTASNPSGPTFTLLSELFTEGFAQALDSTDNSAAFQLAVWEILYENGSPTDLRDGSFRVLSDNGNTPTVDAANYLLTHLPSTGLYSITLLYSQAHQDFIFGTLSLREAPEPSPLPLVGIGLAAMIFVTLRRRGWQRHA